MSDALEAWAVAGGLEPRSWRCAGPGGCRHPRTAVSSGRGLQAQCPQPLLYLCHGHL